VDKKDRAGIEDRMTEVLFRLVLEYQAARNVLEQYGPPNWAKLLHDYRVLLKNHDSARRRVRASIGTLPANTSADAILATLAKVIDDIAPLYPSQVNQQL
jgi:hypothetical protein